MKKIIFLPLVAAAIWLIGCQSQQPYMHLNGVALGTTYSIIYDSADTIQDELEQVMADVESALNIYDPTSIVSCVNRNEDVALDEHFVECFNRSRRIYELTNGAFDISAAPLFTAWGFGLTEPVEQLPTQREIDSLLDFCGMDKVRIEDNRLVKTDPRVTLNANASAKGYTVDAVVQYLSEHGVKNYLVEIGGEVRCAGLNPFGVEWRVGIDKPIEGNDAPGTSLQSTIQLTNRAVATSGNYRRFYYSNGRKISHTINPSTGIPSESALLSATVIADDCTSADALATALMALGLDAAKQWLGDHTEVDALLIYADGNQNFQTFVTPRMQEMVVVPTED